MMFSDFLVQLKRLEVCLVLKNAEFFNDFFLVLKTTYCKSQDINAKANNYLVPWSTKHIALTELGEDSSRISRHCKISCQGIMCFCFSVYF